MSNFDIDGYVEHAGCAEEVGSEAGLTTAPAVDEPYVEDDRTFGCEDQFIERGGGEGRMDEPNAFSRP